MARSHHGKGRHAHIDDPLSPGPEILLKEKIMLPAHDWRLYDADIVTYHFEHVIAEELRDARVSFQDFGLGLFVSANYDDNCIVSEHQVELIGEGCIYATTPIIFLILLEQGLCMASSISPHYVFFTFCQIVFNLNQIVSVEMEGFRVI